MFLQLLYNHMFWYTVLNFIKNKTANPLFKTLLEPLFESLFMTLFESLFKSLFESSV